MTQAPWLTIVGLGEDGADGLPLASRAALEGAEIVMGPPRHLTLLGDCAAQQIPWPVPFADGIDTLLSLRGRRVVVLVSGDPFWFGAGSVLAERLAAQEWQAHPAPSTFTRAASHLGWPLEQVVCLGLHARPLAQLRPHLAPGLRALVLVRDGAAAGALADWLTDSGFGASELSVMEALGGPRARIRQTQAGAYALEDVRHPVCVGVRVAGSGDVLPLVPGRGTGWFESDGQITKPAMRALTMAALAPRPGDHLWDIGAGSGAVSIEWLLAHPSLSAMALEPRADRSENIQANAARFGLSDRLELVTGRAPEALSTLALPQAVFVGGGLSAALLEMLWSTLASGTRLVANAVTLESQALLSGRHRRYGGTLAKIEISQAEPLGSMRGWRAAYPVVQWSVEI